MARAKSKRLVDLLTLLLSARYPVSRAAIRRLEGYPRGEEAFHRQFERDKAALRELGFPIAEVGDEDREPGYLLQRARLKLPEVQLTPEETVALALARRIGGLHSLVGGSVRQALGKLGLVGAGAENAGAVVAVAPPVRSKSEEDRLRLIESAIARGHRLKIRYRSLGAKEANERTIDRTASTCTAAAGTWWARSAAQGDAHLPHQPHREDRAHGVAAPGPTSRRPGLPHRGLRRAHAVGRLEGRARGRGRALRAVGRLARRAPGSTRVAVKRCRRRRPARALPEREPDCAPDVGRLARPRLRHHRGPAALRAEARRAFRARRARACGQGGAR
jgi:hypothetical protein